VRTADRPFHVGPLRRSLRQVDNQGKGGKSMGILWIILIVILVLALLGFFSRGYW
jgi:flagellar basal body-associated protein FliL